MPLSTISSTIEAARPTDETWDAPDDASLPPRWTPDHVALRLVEAFRTLDRLPRPRGPRAAGNHWPAHRLEWADHVAQAELPEAERRDREAKRNALAFRPSGAEIARMDVVLDWLRALRDHEADLALVTSFWALRAARRRSVRAICREMGWKAPTFYYKRKRALGFLADMLDGRGAVVF